MIKLDSKTMSKAIAKAKTVHPRVRVISGADRTYSVTGTKGDNYTVRFAVANGHRLAECDCPARGLCYHIAAASQVNVMVQSMRQAAPPVSPAPTRGGILEAATHAQRCQVENLTMRISLCGDAYTLRADGKDIIVDDGQQWRVDRKGKVTWDDIASTPIVKPQPKGTYLNGWNI